MKNVFVLKVNDTNEDNGVGDKTVHLSAHSTKEEAERYLAAYCRGQWEDQGGHDGHLSLVDSQAIDVYFDFWGPELTWGVDELPVDPDPKEVDHSAEFAAGPEEGDAAADENEAPSNS